MKNCIEMNILVTGAHGQLGNEMVRVSDKSKDHYVFTDINELDITNRDVLHTFVNKEQIDIIVNCAAYTNVDKAEEDERTANIVNNVAVGYLAEAAKSVGATLIHVSTDYVFSGKNNVPYTEHDMPEPIGIYGKTKFAGEKAIVASGCNYIILRTAWLYSVWGNNFFKTMLRLTKERESLNVVFDQIGTPTYAGDLADAIGWIIDHRMIDKKDIYHFTNEGVCSWYDFAVAIGKLGENMCNIRPVHSYEYSSKVKRPHYSVLDKVKFRETFGYQIPYWMESLERCINQLKTKKYEI
jgi:dTDP-4-dehydrorhamnose reductase